MAKDSGDFVLGFLAGTIFGAAMALLYAPFSGEEMREQIRERSIELKERAEDLGLEAGKMAEELRIRGQEIVEEQKTRFQEAVDEGKRVAAQRKEQLLSQIEDTDSDEGSIELTV